MTQSEVLADGLPPVELEVGLNKVACDIDEVIDAVLLTLSDFKPPVAVKKIENGIEVMRVYAVELLIHEFLVNVLEMSRREIALTKVSSYI